MEVIQQMSVRRAFILSIHFQGVYWNYILNKITCTGVITLKSTEGSKQFYTFKDSVGHIIILEQRLKILRLRQKNYELFKNIKMRAKQRKEGKKG